MTVGKLIQILHQFDPEQRVVMECGVHIFEPTILTLVVKATIVATLPIRLSETS